MNEDKAGDHGVRRLEERAKQVVDGFGVRGWISGRLRNAKANGKDS